MTDPEGNTEYIIYDSMSNVTGQTDKNGNTYSYEYDLTGNLIKSTDALSNATIYEYDALNRVIAVTDPKGGKIRNVYDELGNLTKQIGKEGGCWSYTYDPLGRVIMAADPLGRTELAEYDSVGNILSETTPGEAETRYEYDAAGNMVERTDANGAVWKFEYNELSLVTAIADSYDSIYSYLYDNEGNVLKQTDPRGFCVSYSYDALNRVVKTTDEEGYQTTVEYDEVGNVITQTDQLGNVYGYEYDLLDRLISVTKPSGIKYAYQYDSVGNLTETTDSLGSSTKYEYDPLNRLVNVTDAMGYQTGYGYDQVGNMTSMTDANNNTSRWKYNLNGQILEETNPLGSAGIYKYDAAGQLSEAESPDGLVSRYTYNAEGLPSTINYGGDSISYQYDIMGNLTKMESPDSRDNFSYDLLGRLISQNNSELGKGLTFEYDATGNMAKIVNSEDRVTRYTYDGRSSVASLTDPDGNVTGFEYDAAGREISRSLANGNKIAREYDEDGQLASISNLKGNKTLSSFRYQYDTSGNIIGQIEEDGAQTTYSYDALNRLTEAVYPKDKLRSKMQAGEIIQMIDEGEADTGDVMEDSKIIPVEEQPDLQDNDSRDDSQKGGNKRSNDKDNKKEKNTGLMFEQIKDTLLASLDFDFSLLLTAKKDKEGKGNSGNNGNDNNGNSGNNGNNGNNGNGNNGNSGNGKENGNNGNGKGNGNSKSNSGNNGNGYGKYNNPGKGNKYGIYKHEPQEPQEIRFEPSDIERTRYLYLGQSDTLHKEYSPQGAPYAEYYQANGQVISQKMFGLHGRITPGKEETLKTNGGLMYYQYDGIRNVVGLTNRHGDEIEEYRYDAFGNIYTGITAPYNSVGYTGHEYDEKSGLINMNARWYNSNNGRFITQDTYLGDIYTPQSLNRYAYVMNNPVNMWDPTGHVPSWVGDSVHYNVISGTSYVDDVYYLQSSSSSTSDWNLINKITNLTEIIYKYKATKTKTWEYKHLDFNYTTTTDPETGETVYEYSSTTQSYVTYRDTEYHYTDVVVKASEIAQENEEYIRNLAGDPPGDNDPPMFTVSTMQVDDGRIELLNPNEIILRNTGKEPTASERLVAGAVQSELNSIFNTQLDVDGWYGEQSAGTVQDLQKELSLPATGVLDVQTFYQLQLAVESGAKYERSAAPVPTGAVVQRPTGNTGPNYAPSSVPGDYNGNGIPDQYDGYAAQRTSYTPPSSVRTNYAPSNVPGDYNGNGIPDQYDSYAQGTGKSSTSDNLYNILSGTRDFLTGVGMAGLNAPTFGVADIIIPNPSVNNEIAYQAGRVIGDLGITLATTGGTLAFGGLAFGTAPTIVGAIAFGAAAVACGAVAVTSFGRTLRDTVVLAETIKGAGKTPVNPKKVDANYLKRNDIDPHTIKKETLGKNAEISKYDTFVDKNGDIWLRKKGAKEFIPTYENIE